MGIRPVIFGEVLFDCFPENKRVLGGAPFNVAWHLQGFGCNPLFVSAVGSDDLGRSVLDTVSQWFSSTQAIEVSSTHPTGVVQIELSDGTHSFDIRSDQAYDYISGQSLEEVIAEDSPAFLYHGTLILRSETSRRTLCSIANSVQCPIFVDLNLRAPWWNEQNIKDAVSNSYWLKLNEDELCVVSGNKPDSLEALVYESQALLERHHIAAIIVTRGADGAFVSHKGGTTVHAAPVAVTNMVDTVGAGDAFSSVWLLGQLKGWSVETSLRRASAFASIVCGMSGATTMNKDLYTELLTKWESEE